jgi:ABC-type sugar transport system ATPase subunit
MLALDSLSLRAGRFWLRELTLRVAGGEYFVLLGPTGSGKSLLLECLCGLRRSESGRIRLGDRDVTRLAPHQRKIGYLPQQSLLFPHLSVRANLMFAPRLRGLSRRQARDLADPIIRSLGLKDLLDRRPGELSAGQARLVALGRALAAHPDLLLLDEPVNCLDEPARRETCQQLRRAHKDLGATTVHVCSSLAEAALVADRVGILAEGRLVQIGRLEDIRLQPAGAEVSRLLQIDKRELL